MPWRNLMNKSWIILIILIVSCAKTSDSTSATTSGTSTQTCRTYATNATDTTNTITYACTFNGSTTLTCTNGGSETMTFTYSNLQTFVNEYASPVTVFNKISPSTIVINSATPSLANNMSFSYNGSGQLTNITSTSNGITISQTYTSWDSNNRSTAGTAQFTAGATCTGRVLTVTYVDGTTRTRTTNASGGVGANCSSLNPPLTQVDANGDLIQFLGRNITTNATATQCY